MKNEEGGRRSVECGVFENGVMVFERDIEIIRTLNTKTCLQTETS
jgi:hypothetical protein